MTINCYTPIPLRHYCIEHENSLGVVEVLWAVDLKGRLTQRFYPLLRTDVSRGDCSSSALCYYAEEDIPENVRMNCCKYCRRSFHSKCLGMLVEEQLEDPWYCGCHISHGDVGV